VAGDDAGGEAGTVGSIVRSLARKARRPIRDGRTPNARRSATYNERLSAAPLLLRSLPARLRRIALATGLVLVAGCSRPAEPYRPNVLLVILDCLRADHLGAYGYPLPTSPNLDRLAAEGIRFESSYANGTWTKPSMATLFTGLYPSEHGLLRVGTPASDVTETDALADGIPMLAESFAAAGYRTIAAVNQIHLKPEFGFGRGFTDFHWLKGRAAYELNRLVEGSAAAAKPGQPVFAWVHYLDLHWPYRHFRKNPVPELGATAMDPEPPTDQGIAVIDTWVTNHLSEENRLALMARYDREIRYADDALADLVERFRNMGRLDDTLILITSDHGEGFYEHQELMHGFEPYDEVARVPLVIRAPARLGLPGGVRKTLVSHVDLAPTVLDLLGLPPVAGTSGESYLPVLKGRDHAERAVLIQTELTAALRKGKYKLIQHTDRRVELYDLEADPAEKRNLASGGCAGECAALRTELEGRLRKLGPPRAAKGTFTAEETEELRALGYL
jgi:arylsulfatase A-like enzyme